MSRGPKARGEYIGQRAVTSMRLTPACRQEVERSAEASGRSLGQEVEHLLWQGLHATEHKFDVHSTAQRLRALADEIDHLRLTIRA